jgi:undecaprenyl-diphosphatase
VKGKPSAAQGCGNGAPWNAWKTHFPAGIQLLHSLATIAVNHWPGIAPAVWVCAGCIAVSRAVLGFHYLSDVIAGAGLGMLSGLSADLILS